MLGKLCIHSCPQSHLALLAWASVAKRVKWLCGQEWQHTVIFMGVKGDNNHSRKRDVLFCR